MNNLTLNYMQKYYYYSGVNPSMSSRLEKSRYCYCCVTKGVCACVCMAFNPHAYKQGNNTLQGIISF